MNCAAFWFFVIAMISLMISRELSFAFPTESYKDSSNLAHFSIEISILLSIPRVNILSITSLVRSA